MTIVLTDSLQVGGTRLPYLDVSAYDADTIPALTVICEATGVRTVRALTGPAVQGGGVGRWTAVGPHTLTSPGRWFEQWIVVNAVSGTGAGSVTVEMTVEPLAPASGPGQTGAWATVQQYADIVGGALPDNLVFLLRVATLQLRSYVALGFYDAAATETIAALAEACCLQAKHAIDNGWTSGAPTVQRAVSIGSVSLGAASSQAGGSGAVSPISPLAWQVLEAAGLTQIVPATDPYYPWVY